MRRIKLVLGVLALLSVLLMMTAAPAMADQDIDRDDIKLKGPGGNPGSHWQLWDDVINVTGRDDIKLMGPGGDSCSSANLRPGPTPYPIVTPIYGLETLCIDRD
jgi:hypothetical protein